MNAQHVVTQLRERGWSDAAIARALNRLLADQQPTPDASVPDPDHSNQVR